jgi:hypothetical protein
MDVLGVDSTVRLRQFELMLGTLTGFFEKHPEVLPSKRLVLWCERSGLGA